jgi:hypothetical protein
MHRGRAYPYAREFWLPNWCYWPFYAPLHCNLLLAGFPPLDDWKQVTDLGKIWSKPAVPNYTDLSLTWEFDTPTLAGLVSCKASSPENPGSKVGAWELRYAETAGPTGIIACGRYESFAFDFKFSGNIGDSTFGTWSANFVLGHFNGAAFLAQILPTNWGDPMPL